jgi:hypothetical protein
VELLFDLNVSNRKKIEYCLNLLQMTMQQRLDCHALQVTQIDDLCCITLKAKQEERCDLILHFRTPQPSMNPATVESVFVGQLNDDYQADSGLSAHTCFTALLIFQSGQGTYLGGWKNGKYHGFGVYQTQDGVSYQGTWSLGLMHGKGRFQWPDGKVFEGVFHLDRRGEGTTFDSEGNVIEDEGE